MILVIDNYDSFTYNLVHLIGGVRDDLVVHRNDKIDIGDATADNVDAIILSPGPRTPDDAGICLDLVAAAATKSLPVFGVCLGMQAIAQSFGGRVERAGQLMHGKTCDITHDGARDSDGLFAGVASPFTATRYHSLVVARDGLPDDLIIDASAADDNEVMAIRHRTLPIAGVQFHPESIASEHGAAIIQNFFSWIAR